MKDPDIVLYMADEPIKVYMVKQIGNDMSTLGVCEPPDSHSTDYRIKILKGLSQRVKTRTLIHELVHMAFFLSGVGSSLHEPVNEEILCDTVSLLVGQAISQFLNIPWDGSQGSRTAPPKP